MIWSSIVPNVVGGAITAGTAAMLFYVSRRIDKKEKDAVKKRVDARFSLVAFNKLIRAVEATVNLANSIDSEFREAKERLGGEPGELHENVRLMLTPAFDVEKILIEECFFLSKSDKFSIFSDSNRFIRRVQGNELILKKYNEEKRKFQEFIENIPGEAESITSTSIGRNLKGDEAQKANAHVARLNNTLGMLVEAVDKDKSDGKLLAEIFLKAARQEFHADFPVSKLEWKEF